MTGPAPVRLGVLGCADIAARRILPAVTAAKGITLTAVASRGQDKARDLAARFGAEPVTGYQPLLDRSDVDAIYLPLPTALRAEWVERALLAGKHVLAEKPLTDSAKETARLVAMAEERSLALVENFMFPRHSQHTAVRMLLDDGIIGTVLAFAATFAIPARPPDDIRLRPDLGGGALLDVAGYPLRAALLFLGGDLAVRGAFLRTERVAGVDVGGSALLVAGEVTAALTFGLCHEYTSCYEFVGSAGRLTVDHVFTTPAGHHPIVRLVRRNEHEQRTLAADDQFLNSINAFTAAVRRGESVDAETVVRQAELIDDVRSAANRTSPGLGG